LPWQKLGHDWLDVEHWRSVDRVKLGDKELSAFDSDYTADRAPDAIGPVLASLREDPD
jgi:hypothetical protein